MRDMEKMKRIKLTHGTARVGKNCSDETIKALNEMSKVAHKMNVDCLHDNQEMRQGDGDVYHQCLDCGELLN